MFSFRSNVRRFQVISFVLAVVCFATLFLFCQTTAMGQSASGKKTAAATDAGRHSGGQEKWAIKKDEKKTNPDKDKPANSNGKAKKTNTAAKGAQNKPQKNNSVKSSQEIRPFWEKAWDDVKSFFSGQKKTAVTTNVGNNADEEEKIASKETQSNTQKTNGVKTSQEIKPFWEKAWDDIKPTVSKHWNLICITTIIINLIICIWNYAILIPSQRRKSIENDLISLEDFKKVASECMKLRYSNKETTNSQTTNLITYDKAQSIIDCIFKEHIEEYTPQKKTVLENICSFFSRAKYIPISNDDAYLIVLLTWNPEREDTFKGNLNKHRKALCNIFDKRYRACLWNFFTHISLWSLFIFILPLLKEVYKIWSYFNS